MKHWQAEAGSASRRCLATAPRSRPWIAVLMKDRYRAAATGARASGRSGRDALGFRAARAGLGGSVDASELLIGTGSCPAATTAASLWSTRRKPVVTIKRAHGSGAAVQKIGEDVPGPIPRCRLWPARRSDLVVSDPATASCGLIVGAKATPREPRRARVPFHSSASSTIWHVRRPRVRRRGRGQGAAARALGAVPRRQRRRAPAPLLRVFGHGRW